MAPRMIEPSSRPDAPKQRARRLAAGLRRRPVATVAVLAVVLVGAAGVRTLATPRLSPAPWGERLQIEVVAPQEPAITPGAVMEVGELVEGFEGVPPPPPRVETVAHAPWDAAPDDPPPAPPPSGRDVGDADILAPPPPGPPPRDWREGRVARWFGFDAPERDYRAEREARRARFEARERERRDRREWRDRDEGREVRRYHPDGRPYDDGARDDGAWRDAAPEDRFD